MDIFKKQIDKITYSDIKAFVSEGHKENLIIEYKKGFSSQDATLQIAKEISSFANQQGGIIIFGVSEKADRTPDKIVGIDKNKHSRDFQ